MKFKPSSLSKQNSPNYKLSLWSLKARIDGAYEVHINRELGELTTRIDDAYRETETEVRVAAGTAEVRRRLRILVATLTGLLLIGILSAVAYFSLL